MKTYTDMILMNFLKLISFIKKYHRGFTSIGILVAVLGIIFGIFAFFSYRHNEHLKHLYFKTVIQSLKYSGSFNASSFENIDIEDADFIKLVDQYKALIAKDSASVGSLAQYNLALLYYKMKDYASAGQQFQAAGEKDFVFNHHALLFLGHSLMNRARQEKDSKKSLVHLQAAYRAYQKIVSHFAKMPSVFFALKYKALTQELIAKEYIKLEKNDNAIVAYKTSHKDYEKCLNFIKQDKQLFHFTDPYIMYMAQGDPSQQMNVALRRVRIALERLSF